MGLIDVLGEAVLKLSTDDKDFDAGLTRARQKAVRLGQGFDKAGRAATRSLTLPIAAAGAAAAKFSIDFEASLSQITGLVGVSAEQVQAWKGDILALGPAVGKGPQELAEALFFITSAGIEGTEAMDTLTVAAKASAAGLGETATVADAATSAMNAYGSDVLSAAQATNTLVATVREGKLEAASLSGVLGRVIPTASAMGVTFDQVGASIAAMSRLGSSAEQAATQLSATMASLQKVTPDAEAALNEFGMTSANMRKQIREGGLLDVLETLKDRIGDNDTAMARIFPNVQALRGVLGLVGANAESTRKIFDSLATDTNALDNAFLAASGTAKFQLAQGMSELKVAMITLGDAVTPVIVPMFQDIAKFIGRAAAAFRELSPETQEMIVKGGLLVAALGPVLTAIGLFVTALGAILSPVVLVVAAVAGLATAVVLNWDTIVASTKAMFEGVKLWMVDKFMAIINGVKAATDAVTGFFNDMFMAVVGGSIVPDMIDGVGFEFSMLDFRMVEPAKEATEAVAEDFESMADRIKNALDKIDFGLVSSGQKLNAFSNILDDVFDKSTTGSQVLKNAFGILGGLGKAAIAAGVAAGTIGLGTALVATAAIGLGVKGASLIVDKVSEGKKGADLSDEGVSASNTTAGGAGGTTINISVSDSVLGDRQAVERLIVPALQQIDRTGALKLGGGR